MRIPFTAALLAMSAAHPVSADISSLTGLFYPAPGEYSIEWSCSPDDVGLEGGALQVTETSLHGVENTCAFTKVESGGEKTFVQAQCQSEGFTENRAFYLSLSPQGIFVEEDTYRVEWIRCESQMPDKIKSTANS